MVVDRTYYTISLIRENNIFCHLDIYFDLFSSQIADFGFSKNIPSCPLTASRVGSPLYSSPEIIQGKPYQGPECDVWSLGVILYTMLTATMPFDDSNMGQFLMEIKNGNYPEPYGTSDGK